MLLGPIGTYDEASRHAYAAAFNGAEIPSLLDSRSEATRQYMRWRAEAAVSAVRAWSQTARELNPAIVICANNLDGLDRNSFVTIGADLESLADVQDVLLLEDFAMPCLQEDGSVIANAINIGATQARADITPVSTLPFREGPGYEHAPSPRQFSRAMAEAAAMNVPLVVNGTGYLHRNELTLLLHSRYGPQQRVLSAMNHWLDENGLWLSQRRPTSPLGVYHPYEAVRWEWNRITPVFIAACETLLVNGYPLRIVGDDDDWTDLRTVIMPPGQVDGLEQRLGRFVDEGGRVIALGQRRPAVSSGVLWESWRPVPNRIPHVRWLRRRLSQDCFFLTGVSSLLARPLDGRAFQTA
jgi:hypothetical protein